MKELTNWSKFLGHFSSAFCCEICRGPVSSFGICGNCLHDLPYLCNACELCGTELPEAGLCGGCIRSRPLIDRTVCAFKYAYPVDSLIKKIKYKQRLNPVEPLVSHLINQVLKSSSHKIDLLVPVPMPNSRQVLRGMNQAMEIARLLGREFSIPVDGHRLKRTRYTPPMHALDISQRQQNVRGAFSWSGAPPDSVAIIDDVITTGATCSAICDSLKSKGACHVEAWALARVC